MRVGMRKCVPLWQGASLQACGIIHCACCLLLKRVALDADMMAGAVSAVVRSGKGR